MQIKIIHKFNNYHLLFVMIFSYYQDANKFIKEQSHGFVPTSNENNKNKQQKHIRSMDKKQSVDYSKPNWLKRKSSKFDELNKSSSFNTTSNINFVKMPVAKFFLKTRTHLSSKQSQQTPSNKQKQKRFHSQSDFFQHKRRKVQYDKLFNQTLIDSQHNFIGKNYLKQVENFKMNPSKNKEYSPNNLFSTTKCKILEKQKSTCLLFDNTSKIIKHQEWNHNLFVKKRLSLNDKFLVNRTSEHDGKNAQKQKIQCDPQSLSQKLRKQIEKNVKDDIKAEMNKFKKSKLAKFRFTDKNYKIEKKSLQISQNNNESIQQVSDLSQSTPQKLLNFMSQYNNCKMIFKQKKGAQVIKKSHSSFQNYQARENKGKNQSFTFSVYEELDPWQSETIQFHGFR